MSKTYFKLDNDWIGMLQQLNEKISEYGTEVLTTVAQEYADEVVPEDADEYEFESAVHFFTAIYFIWRKDTSVTRIKFKHINKLAESMMDTVTELTNNPKERTKLEVSNFLKEKASECL